MPDAASEDEEADAHPTNTDSTINARTPEMIKIDLIRIN
jgi:hypothetical protein